MSRTILRFLKTLSPPFHPSAEGSHSTLPPPPSYALYRASAQEIRKNGDLVSHDAHLNDDGEALARFLIQQAEQAPSIRILCQGTHTQTTTSSRMSGDVSGAFNSEDGTTNEVVDFKFIISVPVPLNSDQEGGNRPVLWSVGDMEPVFRGGSHREVDTQNGRCAAVTDDTRRWREVRETRRLKGLPPWGGQGAWKSSKSLREWADAYCADRDEGLKEFVFEKVVHGWDISRLEESLRSIIREAGYWSGDVKVEISTHASRVIIR
ncbi:hypothetical protein DL96DRAFT_1459973 [Flagelloscypha sp. PMI_526]|nr:hypothetical protein DL96DRAFT_1459973 [Flagelloscypha sp. PMI_526]